MTRNLFRILLMLIGIVSFAQTTSVPNCTALAAPANGAFNVSVTTDLSWTASSTATGYKLSVGTTSGGTEIFTGDIGNVISYDLASNLPEADTFYVTIIPYNTLGDAIGCAEEQFTTETLVPVPSCPTLLTPINGATNVSLATDLIWAAVNGASGYFISAGTANGGTDILSNEDVGPRTNYVLSNDLPAETVIYINITPYNAGGGITGCMEESFTTAASSATIPSCTLLSLPENGETEVPTNSVVNWNEISGANGYYLSIGTSSGGTDLVDNVDIGLNNEFNLSADYASGTTIYINVVPYNAEGNATGCVEQSFTTVSEIVSLDESKYGFSPDGDGINEFWEIKGIENHPENQVFIFNRWGDIVFQIEGYDNQSKVFGGQANRLTGLGADLLPEGTYFFRIQVSGETNLKKLNGYLVLKR